MQGLAFYPGLDAIHAAAISYGLGTTPSSFSITVAPQRSLPKETGDLRLEWGSYFRVFRDCRVDQVSFSTDGATLLTVTILDRRWRWAFGSISGHYNIRNLDGTVRGHLVQGDRRAIANSERTPRELASLLLDAMGEKGYSVADLPNDARPTVEWEADNPAAMLANLCEELGCVVVLEINDRVAIRRLNTGGRLPNIQPEHSRSGVIDPQEMPDALHVVCGPTLYQVDLPIIALAEETDGSLVPLDDVSYKPVDGWSLGNIPEFLSIADHTARNLAKRSVFRYFGVRLPCEVPGYGIVEALSQLLPLNDHLVDSTKKPDGTTDPKPAFMFGVWTAENGESVNQAEELIPVTDDQDETVIKDFIIDAERGVLITTDYIYKLEGEVPNLTLAHPNLIFRTAATVRDPETMAYLRYERVRKNKGRRFGTGPKILKHDDIRYTVRCDYVPSNGPQAFVPGKLETNVKDVDREADYYLDAEATRYDASQSETIVYAGLYPIELDGINQRVTYNVGAPFASTTVERGRDPGNRNAIPYRLQRALEKMKAAQDLQKKLEPRQLRDRARRSGGK